MLLINVISYLMDNSQGIMLDKFLSAKLYFIGPNYNTMIVCRNVGSIFITYLFIIGLYTAHNVLTPRSGRQVRESAT